MAPAESAPQRPTRGNDWVLHHAGSGVIPNLTAETPLQIPFARRVHVAFLPEGFTAADLATGVFDAEVDRWINDITNVEPYASFREALVFWKRAVPSRERMSSAGADTAFSVNTTADGRGVGSVPPVGTTATRVWRALRDFPVALQFWGGGGRTAHLARNLVVVMITQDPATGAPGLSGRTVTLLDPRDARRRVPLAIAFDRAHEFTHAFSRLVDEYLEDDLIGSALDNARAGASPWMTNVVARRECASLPWKHLLPGSPFNPDVHEVVGAFGTPGHGYHAELTCLMNGVHDNARYYGGNGRLRSSHRLCNFCREMTAFRLYERVGVLPDQAHSLETWEAVYRAPFYDRFGFQKPEVIPQRNNQGVAIYEPCEGEMPFTAQANARRTPPAAAAPAR